MVSLLPTKFHETLFSSFRGVALTNCDGQTDGRTDGQDKNNMSPPHGRSLLLEQVTFQWDDDDICFVLDQHTEFDFYCTNSLKQQSEGNYRNVAPLQDILIWIWVNISLFLNAACLVKKQEIHILLVNWVDLTRSTIMKSNTLTMTSQKQKIKLW